MCVNHAGSHSDANSFEALGVVDLLNADSRPTFVIRTDIDWCTTGQLQPIFLNAALRDQVRLNERLFGKSVDDAVINPFRQWIQKSTLSSSSTYWHANTEWNCTVVAGTWRVVGAVRVLDQSQSNCPPSSKIYCPGWSQDEDRDWTQAVDSTGFCDHVQYLRHLNWGSTSLGAMPSWPIELRLLVNMMMRSEVPQMLYWGHDLTAIYNQALAPLIGAKHPTLLGNCIVETWPEVWSALDAALRRSCETGMAIDTEQKVLLERSGIVQEVLFDYSNVPIVGSTGKVLGYYITVRETTETLIAERRSKTISDVRQQMANYVMVGELCNLFLGALGRNKDDILFAVIYAQETEGDDDAVSHTKTHRQSRTARLRGALGLLELDLPPTIDAESDSEPFARLLQTAYETDQHVILRKGDEVLCGIHSNTSSLEFGHGAEFEQAVLYALRVAGHDEPLGFLLMGLNATRPWNQAYKHFATSVSTHFNNALGTMITYQRELRQQQQQANLERNVLQKRLAQQTRQAKEMEQRFTRLTDASPAAVSIAKLDGTILYANDTWRSYFELGNNSASSMSWLDNVHPDDLAEAERQWSSLTLVGTVINYEFRIKKPWMSATSSNISLPYTCIEVISTSIDITHQKWIQQEAQQRTEEAVRAKHQQDAFTDMVAHEIRNPLNAIIQCADIIQTSFRAFQGKWNDSELTQEAIENAQTITYCALHQKKIVDDLLILSKLDSDLLSFVPVSSRPIEILSQTVKMFEVDARAHDITLTSNLHPSLAEHHVDWMMLDPQRISQVLINLITNAIKFTKKQAERSVTVRLFAAPDRSSFKDDYGLKFFPTNRVRSSAKPSSDDLFLLFSVTDTGLGISAAVESHLFQRFSQASLRTHIEYGGSGLGLWISRELTEMQGGEIGFKTHPDGGTTFAFYVCTRYMPPPSQSTRSTTVEDCVEDQVREKILDSAQPQSMGGASRADDVEKTIDLKSFSILLTEDNLINQKVMKKQLEKIFGNVLVANNGKEAIELIQKSRRWRDVPIVDNTAGAIDLVLMDIEMPVMNGLDCTKGIRDLEARGKISTRIPIVAISANARAEQVAEYREAGIDDALPKPFVIRDLVALITRIMQHT